MPRANFLPNCPYYFSVFMGVPCAFCVWCMVSSLHSTYILLCNPVAIMSDLLKGKEKSVSFFSVHTMNGWAFRNSNKCVTGMVWNCYWPLTWDKNAKLNHCDVWCLFASKYVELWLIMNLQDFTSFASLRFWRKQCFFKWRDLTKQHNVIHIIWLLLRKLLTPAIKIYFSRNALIHVFFLYTVNL